MSESPSSGPSVLMVEPLAGGHTVKNYGALLESPTWENHVRRRGSVMHILCPERLRDRLQDRVSPYDISGAVLTDDGPDVSKWGRRRTFSALMKRIQRRRYDRVVLMYLDDLLFLLPLVRCRLRGVHLSGLYVRPMAHFAAMGYPTTGKVRFRWAVAWVKNRLLLGYLKAGILDSCVFQDEGAVMYFRERKTQAFWLPTPLSHSGTLTPVGGDRIRYTLFGEMSRRKGVFRVRDAWMALPLFLQNRVELRLVGQPRQAEETAIRAAVRELREAGWQVFTDFRFVGDEEIPGIHENTDVLLLPYRNHLGTSGVLVQALCWGIPVIVDDFGWPAHMLAELKMGTAVDTADPAAFASAVGAAMARDEPGHEQAREHVVRNHSRDRYGEALCEGACGEQKLRPG